VDARADGNQTQIEVHAFSGVTKFAAKMSGSGHPRGMLIGSHEWSGFNPGNITYELLSPH
jgi:hypothetical protein